MKSLFVAVAAIFVTTTALAAECKLTITQSSATELSEVSLGFPNVKIGKPEKYRIISARFPRHFEGHFIMLSVLTGAGQPADFVKLLDLERATCKDEMVVNPQADSGSSVYSGVATTCEIKETEDLLSTLSVVCLY